MAESVQSPAELQETSDGEFRVYSASIRLL